MGALCGCKPPSEVSAPTSTPTAFSEVQTPNARSVTDESLVSDDDDVESDKDASYRPMISITDLSPNFGAIPADLGLSPPDYETLLSSSIESLETSSDVPSEEDDPPQKTEEETQTKKTPEPDEGDTNTHANDNQQSEFTGMIGMDRLMHPPIKTKQSRRHRSGIKSEKKKIPLSVRYSPKVKVDLILHFFFRDLFTMVRLQQIGHFIEYHLIPMVHLFFDPGLYPRGNLTLAAHSNWVRCSVVSECGIWLWTCSFDNSVIKWDLSRTKLMKRWRMSDMECAVSLNYHRCGYLALGSFDGSVFLRQAQSFELIWMKEQVHSAEVNSVEFNYDGSLLLSCSNDSTLRLWNIKSGDCSAIFHLRFGNVTSAIFINDLGTQFLSSSIAECIQLWNVSSDLEENNPLETLEQSTNVSDLCFNCDRTLLACLVLESSVIIRRWPKTTIKVRIEESALSVRFHPLIADVLAISVRDGNEIRLFRINEDDSTAECIHVFEGHNGFVNHLCFTPNGQRLISASRDKKVKVWKMKLQS